MDRIDLVKNLQDLAKINKYLRYAQLGSSILLLIITIISVVITMKQIKKAKITEIPRKKFQWEILLGNRGVIWNMLDIFNSIVWTIFMMVSWKLILPHLSEYIFLSRAMLESKLS
tara:strand:- start:13 stop:357 length:345 start_codon:yes stop_codon:yes gene_type:complete